jgi:hypothetical protein
MDGADGGMGDWMGGWMDGMDRVGSGGLFICMYLGRGKENGEADVEGGGRMEYLGSR